MLLFVGLGNPGKEHARNRHNIGAIALSAIGRRYDFERAHKRFDGAAAEGTIGTKPVLLLMPLTYMNDSGRSVAQAMRFYRLKLSEIVVLHDEIELPPLKVRVKVGGGVAGHNGLRSITAHVGNDYKRMRIGVGRPHLKEMVHRYVLHDFAKGEWDGFVKLCDVIADNAKLLVDGRDDLFQNKVHLTMEETGFFQPSRPSRQRKSVTLGNDDDEHFGS